MITRSRKSQILKSAATPSVFFLFMIAAPPLPAAPQDSPGITSREFAREVERVLPAEKSYAYHRRLSEGPVHAPMRDPAAEPSYIRNAFRAGA